MPYQVQNEACHLAGKQDILKPIRAMAPMRKAVVAMPKGAFADDLAMKGERKLTEATKAMANCVVTTTAKANKHGLQGPWLVQYQDQNEACHQGRQEGGLDNQPRHGSHAKYWHLAWSLV